MGQYPRLNACAKTPEVGTNLPNVLEAKSDNRGQFLKSKRRNYLRARGKELSVKQNGQNCRNA
jgi:hypothetical protein